MANKFGATSTTEEVLAGINLRGNRTPTGKGCRFEGFYMNEPVAGIHQGWTESYFGAIDRKRIVASNHYCMAPQR